MKFALLIGSYARGDYDSSSDCDILLINIAENDFDTSALPIQEESLINPIYYDQTTFSRLYDIGSLFLFHSLSEGVLLEGNVSEWENLKRNFKVQQNFHEELTEISKITNLLSKTEIFGGRYLTPLVNAFTELKNACIFSLAHNGIYEFNKSRCFDLALGLMEQNVPFKELKAFYDFSVRGLDIKLPFDPNNGAISSSLLRGANTIVGEMCHACK